MTAAWTISPPTESSRRSELKVLNVQGRPLVSEDRQAGSPWWLIVGQHRRSKRTRTGQRPQGTLGSTDDTGGDMGRVASLLSRAWRRSTGKASYERLERPSVMRLLSTSMQVPRRIRGLTSPPPQRRVNIGR